MNTPAPPAPLVPLEKVRGDEHDEAAEAPTDWSLRRVLAQWASELRFVDERPSSLRDFVAYARRGHWTTEVEGSRRTLMLLWMHAVAIPAATLLYLGVWQVSRPARCVSLLGIELALGTALDQIPIVQWFIPDLFDVATWWPLSLL